jgi:hypothetical protein
MGRVSLALVHYPVVDKFDQLYTTAITNIDVHDIARSARTFGLDQYYIISPIDAQRKLADTIATFWIDGTGHRRNPDRANAMGLVNVAVTLEECLAREESLVGEKPVLIATSAKPCPKKIIRNEEGQQIIKAAKSSVLVFGTGYGLAPSIIDMADYLLEPICGSPDYNHLSVRSAAAITLDRLFRT